MPIGAGVTDGASQAHCITSNIHIQRDPVEWAMLLLLSVLWGGSFFFVGVAVRNLPTLAIVVLRVSLAALVLWGVVAVLRRPVPSDLRVWIAFLVMGVVNNVIPFSLIVWGRPTIASGLASTLNATTPLFTVAVPGLLLSDERINGRKLMGIAAGFIVVAAGHGTGSTLVLASLALVIDRPWALSMPALSTWAAIAGLAGLSTALTYILDFQILQHAGATDLLLVTFLIPVSAIAPGVLFLGEHLSGPEIAGMVLIGAGLLAIAGRVLNIGRRRSANTQAAIRR